MIPLLIVDRARWMCQTLAHVLRNEADIEVVGLATRAEDAVPYLDTPNLILVSATLPSDGTLETLRAVIDLNTAKAKVVVVDLAETQVKTLPEWEAGTVDCMLDDQAVAALLKKIRAVHRVQSRVWARVSAPGKN